MAEYSSLVGQTVSHYRIIEKIGAGGMGEVYRAYDERLERDVALKVLHPGMLAGESARKRFRKEALALSKLNHPNIATVHDFDTQGGVDFLIMEHVAGETLSEKVRGGSLAEKEVVRLGLQLAEGLAAARLIGEQGQVTNRHDFVFLLHALSVASDCRRTGGPFWSIIRGGAVA